MKLKDIEHNGNNHAKSLRQMTDADIDDVLDTVAKKVALSVAQAEQAHKKRLGEIVGHHGR